MRRPAAGSGRATGRPRGRGGPHRARPERPRRGHRGHVHKAPHWQAGGARPVRTARPRGGRAQDTFGTAALGGTHHGPSGLDDARLFRGDGLDGIAQPARVVHRNGGDDRDNGINRIGGIQTPSHAGLEHHDIAAPPGKPPKRQHRRQLEVGGRVVPGLRGPAQEAEPGGNARARDGPPIDPDPFGKIHEMGGRVEAAAKPGFAQTGIKHGADRPLAVRAGDMDHGRARVAGCFEQAAGVFEAELDAELLRRKQPIEVLTGRVGGPRVRISGRVHWWIERLGDEGYRVRPCAPHDVYSRARARVSLSFDRWTTASMSPCRSRNSAVWNPSGRS